MEKQVNVMTASRRVSLLPSKSTSPSAPKSTPQRKLFTDSDSTELTSQVRHDAGSNELQEGSRRITFQEALAVGDTVMTPLRAQGKVKFIGQINGKPDTYVGISLIGNSSGKGKNNGSFDGVEYFKADQDNGLFLPYSKVRKLDSFTLNNQKSPSLTDLAISTPTWQVPHPVPLKKLERYDTPQRGKPGKDKQASLMQADTVPPLHLQRSNDKECEETVGSLSGRFENVGTQHKRDQESNPKKAGKGPDNPNTLTLFVDKKTQQPTISDMHATLEHLRSRISLLERSNLEAISELSMTQMQLDEKDMIILNLENRIEAKREEFRSVLENLEKSHAETTKVYENRLLEMEDRDIDGVVEQLKTLEDVISALEEGLLISEEETKRARESAEVAINNTTRVDILLATNEQLQKSNSSLKDEIHGLKDLVSSISTARFDISPKSQSGRKLTAKAEQNKAQLIVDHDGSQSTLLNDSKRKVGDSSKEYSGLWCEICESHGHDILSCDANFGYSGKLVGKGKDEFCEHCRESRKTDLFHTVDTCPYVDTSF